MVGAIDDHLGRTKVAAQLDVFQAKRGQVVYRRIVVGAINVKHRDLECCKRKRSLQGLPIVNRTQPIPMKASIGFPADVSSRAMAM